MAPRKIDPPATLPSDFSGWDKQPPSTLPADFKEWDSPKAPAVPAHPPVDMKVPESFGGTYLKRLGDNASGLIKPMLHPIDSMMSHPDYAKPWESGDLISDIRENPNSTGVANALADTTTALAASGAMHAIPMAGRLVEKAGTGLRNLAAKTDNAIIGTPAEAYDFGADPGRALSTNRITGSNPAVISSKIKSVIPDAAAEHRGIVAANPGGSNINAGHLISDPFNSVVDAATDAKIGASTPAQVSRANLTRRVLTSVVDPNTGKPTSSLRDPILTPLEATDFKSNIYGMADYDNPSKAALANKGLKGAAHNLKVAVEQAVPESIESGQRLHDLMAAKDVVEPMARGSKLPTSKSGLIEMAVTKTGTTGAATADIAGSGMQKIGRGTQSGSAAVGKFINAPVLMPLFFRPK